MTISFEDQLREDLRAAVGDASFDAAGGFEPASVIRLGQRAVQRRRLGYAASLAALAVVAVVAVLPATVLQETPFVPQGFDAGWTTSAYQELGGTGYRAQVYRLTGQNAPPGFEGFVWHDRAGAIHGPSGAVLPAADFPDPEVSGGVVRVWWDRERGIFGSGADGPQRVTPLPDELQVSAHINNESTSSGTVFGVAPAGSTNIRAEFTPSTHISVPLTTHPMGDTREVAF